jgi:uncharacterized protein
MKSAYRARPALALSNLDLPDAQELLLHACEDCACSVSDDRQAARTLPAVIPDGGRWVSGQEIVEIPLDSVNKLLFNPLGQGGVVVVNDDAYRMFRSFCEPTTLAEVQAQWPGRADDVEKIFRRLGQLQMVHPCGKAPRPDFASAAVLTAWLHVTNACNLRCPYCYVNKTAEGMDEDTGRAAVEAVVDSAIAHGFPAIKLKYAGGEASLSHRLLVRLHTYAQELTAARGLQLYATLLSNGVALSHNLVDILKTEHIGLMISLDGLGSQHDAQRPFADGRPSFHLVERTIAHLLEQDYPPHLSITITNRNTGGLADLVRFALDRNLTFSFNLFRDNDCASSFPDLQYAEQTMIAALLDAFAVIEEYLPRWSALGSILDRGQLLQPRQRSCGVGQDYVVIDHRGQVAKCHMEIERTLGDVFSGDPLQLVREDTTTALNLLADEKEGCRNCTWRYWCSGGCTVATFRATGRYDIKSPNCNIYKAIYPQALRLEALRILKYATPADIG